MPKKKRLTSEQREFFTLIRQATFANPFSDHRVALDLQIAGISDSCSDQRRIDLMIREVHKRVSAMEQDGPVRVDQFDEADRSLVENVLLFDFFHQFIDDFDALIPVQIQAGTKSVRVPFAGKAMDVLIRRGFGPQDANRYFALCWQLRRAFYFIYHHLVGRSESMKTLRRSLWNNVFTRDIGIYHDYLINRMEDFSTLILGETGTGKGTSALAIGRSGFIPYDAERQCFQESFIRSFVSLNLSQYPESLIESELFGHRKGAFTGAVEDHQGVFDRCSAFGSIFLDEIGDVSIPVQIKLLQVLQERIFFPVGSHTPRRFQGRVIAATNRSLKEIRNNGILRDDFFYRLCSDVITVPSLRQRIREDPGELDDLLQHTLNRILGSPGTDLVHMVRETIEAHPGLDYQWPGNVRELEQCVRSILLKGAYPGDLKSTNLDLESRIHHAIETGQFTAQQLLSAYCQLLYQREGTYEAVARCTHLDRRTVKKYINGFSDNT